MHFDAAPTSPGANRTQSVLRFSLLATLAYVAVTFAAGLRAHSLALLSEAGHNVSDFLALLLSFAAVRLQSRPVDHSKTFGYQRAGVLAAFINAASLIAISLWIAIEAVHRLSARWSNRAPAHRRCEPGGHLSCVVPELPPQVDRHLRRLGRTSRIDDPEHAGIL